MAFKNKIISNAGTGQEIRFIQTARETNGRLLEMETTYHAHSKEPVAHYHPHQAEDFRVLAGELTVRISGKLKVLKPGDVLHIPANTVHAMWNNTSSKTTVNWTVTPAMNTENFLETVMGLAKDGRTNKEGIPGVLQASLIANKYASIFRLSKPPYFVQRMLFSVLAPFAYLLGYRHSYQEYID
ncbi:MAG TPA: cupin domain-containing protein [Chitinophagales bacterium]|nr:cupin domain-containing protein [Chitinophagales bacterium]